RRLGFMSRKKNSTSPSGTASASTTKSRRNRPEEIFQRQVCQYLTLALPPGAVFFMVNNATPRRVMRKILAALGLKPGIPDLCIVFRGRSIFIELKAKRGRLSPAQKAMHAQLVLAGAVVHTVRSLDELEGFLSMLIPLQARVAA